MAPAKAKRKQGKKAKRGQPSSLQGGDTAGAAVREEEHEIRQLEKWNSGNIMNESVFQAILAEQQLLSKDGVALSKGADTRIMVPPPVEQQANVPAPKRVTISSEFGVTNLNVLEGHPISQHHPPPPVGGDQYGCLPFGPAAAAVAAAGSPTGDMQAQSSQVNVDVGHHVHGVLHDIAEPSHLPELSPLPAFSREYPTGMLPSLPPAAASTGDTSTRAKAKSKAKAKPKPSKSKATSSSVKQQGLTASQATHNPHHQRPWSLRPSPAKAPPPGSRSPAPPSSSLIPAVHHQLSSRGSHQQPEVPSSAAADAAMSILQHLNSPHSLTSFMSPPTETPSSSTRHLAGQTRKRGLHSRKDEIDMATFLLLSPEEQDRERKRMVRMQKNRDSARRSRDRRIARDKVLQSQVDDLQASCELLREQLEDEKRKRKRCQEENLVFQRLHQRHMTQGSAHDEVTDRGGDKVGDQQQQHQQQSPGHKVADSGIADAKVCSKAFDKVICDDSKASSGGGGMNSDEDAVHFDSSLSSDGPNPPKQKQQHMTIRTKQGVVKQVVLPVYYSCQELNRNMTKTGGRFGRSVSLLRRYSSL